MNFTRIFLGFTLIATVAAAKIPAVTLVSSSTSRETRRSNNIAPGSSISEQKASVVASKMQSLVPGTVIYSVRPTGSMRPLFDGNCVLLTQKKDFDSLKVGDIVVYRHSRTGELIVHRILERKAGGYWTKGDHNDKMDDDIVTDENYQACIYGIIYTERSMENVSLSARQGLGLMVASN